MKNRQYEKEIDELKKIREQLVNVKNILIII